MNITTIDLLKQTIGSDLESRQFLDGIIYANYTSGYKEKFKIIPNTKSLYEYLTEKEKSYFEYYYFEYGVFF